MQLFPYQWILISHTVQFVYWIRKNSIEASYKLFISLISIKTSIIRFNLLSHIKFSVMLYVNRGNVEDAMN